MYLLLIVAPFICEDVESKSSIIQPPKVPDPNSLIETLPWTAEEDGMILQSSKNFQFNWSLISDSLSNRRNRVVQRSDWECYNRLIYLNDSAKKPVDSPMVQSSTLKNPIFPSKKQRNRQDRETRLQKLFSTFEMIQKCTKRRETVKPTPAVKKISLVAHETHLNSQNNAGVIIGAPPLGPVEVSLLKDRREMEMRQQQEQRKFFDAGLRPVLPGGMMYGYGQMRQQLMPNVRGALRPNPDPKNNARNMMANRGGFGPQRRM